MTKLINVGVDLNSFDQFLYLPKRFTAEHDEFEIAIHHHGADQKIPRLYNSSFELMTDSIDIFLHPAASAQNSIVPLANHVSMQLWEKPAQLSFLHRLKQTTKNPVLDMLRAQKYVCVIPDSPRQQAKRQFSQMQELGDKFVIRPNIGANGLGVKIISGDRIPKTVQELNSIEWIEGIAETEDELRKYSETGFHFCEYIHNASEIRVVRCLDGNIISAVRSKATTELSNDLELGRVKSDYSAVLRDSTDGLPISCDQITELLREVEPMQKAGSYDIWVNEHGEFGLYEFSTQFALNCCEPKLRDGFMRFYLSALVRDALSKM